MKVALAAAVLGAAALVFPVGQLAGDHQTDQARMRQIGRELVRLHKVQDRLRAAVARGVPEPLRALAIIQACESGGRPDAVSSGGTYRSSFQFDASTWRSTGGRGDPAAASMAQQWARALLLFDARGTQPWPTCRRGV